MARMDVDKLAHLCRVAKTRINQFEPIIQLYRVARLVLDSINSSSISPGGIEGAKSLFSTLTEFACINQAFAFVI
jgi:hypothetical protein